MTETYSPQKPANANLAAIRHWSISSVLAISVFAALSAGCLSEQSFPMQTEDVRRIQPLEYVNGRYRTVREWLVHAQTQLKPLLPISLGKPLLTEDLVRAGKPVDVFKHFAVNPNTLQTVVGNYQGILCTAQLVSMTSNIDTPAAAWPGFDDVWIPVDPKVSLAGRLGFAKKDGRIVDAPCIVILPGFFGDIGVQRSRDLAAGLIQSGYHVLAVNLRGHGQTEKKYPDLPYLFGVYESGDLLAVAEWLQTKPHVISTGLIGYCWGGHTALLVAWDDARCGIDPSVSQLIAPHMRARAIRHHYTAGIMSLSPALRWEEIMDWLDTEHAPLDKPMYAGIQDNVRARKERKGMQPLNGSLRELIAAEFQRSELNTPRQLEDAFTMMRFMPYKNKQLGDRMGRVRVPVLIVQAADDPAIPAQWTADFAAITENTNVASLILPSGGHVGFAAWARQYYFSLIVNFFDPARGATAATSARYEIREFNASEVDKYRPQACPAPIQSPSTSAPLRPAPPLH